MLIPFCKALVAITILLVIYTLFRQKKKSPANDTIYDFKVMETPVDVFEDLPVVGTEGSLYYVEYTEEYYYWKDGRYHIYKRSH